MNIPFAVFETYRILYNERGESIYYDSKRLVNIVSQNQVIKELCEKLGITNQLDDIQEKYNKEKYFNEIVKEVHKMIQRQEEARNGVTHIDN
ncbi:MAG: hypothetical protein BAJALOKI1v1_280011 [Promethearchaeota archaeon]|nr:MAG: hypothetical protein BAJALOKI1v1_280011 [Candidatus Lokiarchaeota archaeon]